MLLLTLLAALNCMIIFSILGQTQNQEQALPYADYWPIIFLPIFVIVLYRVWKKRRNK